MVVGSGVVVVGVCVVVIVVVSVFVVVDVLVVDVLVVVIVVLVAVLVVSSQPKCLWVQHQSFSSADQYRPFAGPILQSKGHPRLCSEQHQFFFCVDQP
jgi:hypothetical protein